LIYRLRHARRSANLHISGACRFVVRATVPTEYKRKFACDSEDVNNF
jgi:hypothetical protein